MTEFTNEIRHRVECLLHEGVTRADPVARGYTAAGRWRLRLDSGADVFVKVGASATTAEALRLESHVYDELNLPFMPRLLAWEDHPLQPLMILDDLSTAYWPPPWNPRLVDEVLSTLEELHSSRAQLKRSVELHGSLGAEWSEVAKDPEPFLNLRLVTPTWLERALPGLLEASTLLEEDADQVIHLDVRSDNLCQAPRGVVLVDWSWAALGNGALDTGFWLPSLQAEGGPAPEAIFADPVDRRR